MIPSYVQEFIHSCVRTCVHLNSSICITRIQSQNFEIVPYESPEIPGVRPCGVNGNDVDTKCDVETKRWWMASECHLWLCEKWVLVLGSDATPCVGVNECFCSRGCECPLLQYKKIGLIHPPIEHLKQHKINLYVLIKHMIRAAISACFLFAIVIILTGCTCKIWNQGTNVLRAGGIHVHTYCRRAYYLLKVGDDLPVINNGDILQRRLQKDLTDYSHLIYRFLWGQKLFCVWWQISAYE